MTVAPPPASGVPGLTPTQVRAQIARMGWTGALPIVAHDAKHQGAGKAPGIRAWQDRTRFEGPQATAADLDAWARKERQWPGTGIAGGDLLVVDADFATDAALADRVAALAAEVFGETPFHRQGQAPKVALVYRAAEPIASVSLKVADGSGDGLDILAEGRQLVAFGVHRKTLKPYAWIASESPLTAGPDQAPEVTQSQVNAFLSRLRGLVELNGTGGRAGRGSGEGSGEITRDADGRVIDGREYHLTRIVYATACAVRVEGTAVTVAELAVRAWEAFTASTVLDDGRWSPEAARVKAGALIDRVRRGLAHIGETEAGSGEAVAPSYPDHRVPLPLAEAAVVRVVAGFFDTHAPAWKAARIEWEAAAEAAEEAGQDAPAKPEPVSWAARVETAIGKTALAIRGAAGAAKAGLSIVYAVPTHQLGTEIAERFAAEGVTARVYRGYTSPDPEVPDLAMCLDLPAMQDARDAVRPIPSTVCERKVDGQKLLCRFHDRCGMERQRRAEAPVWLVPHALLFQARPGAIPAPDALVIDEGVTMGALPDKPARLSLDAIERAPVDPGEAAPLFTNAANDLDAARGALLRGLRDQRDDGPVTRAALTRNDVTAGLCGEAYKLEWARLRDPGIAPGMEPTARKACAAAVGQHNAEVKALAGAWAELRTFLNGGAEASGRLALRYDPETEARILERRSLDTVRSTWAAPALILDATLPDPALIEPVVGHRVEVQADITARWSPHVRVRQIVGAPVTARKLGIIGGQEEEAPRRVVRDLMRLIRLRAALVWPRVAVVVGPKRLVEVLTEAGFPPNVETGHFGAVAGIDRWKDAAGLICIGQMQPGPRTTEPLAGIITGQVPEILTAGDFGGAWYTRTEGGIRRADGTGARIEHGRHPDPVVEGLRWQITEAGLIQAIGRLRALRRGPEAPAFLDIIGDVPLPISVDQVVPWEDAKPGAWAEMADEGIILASAGDIEACFPEAAPTRKAAREMCPPSMALTSIREIYIDVRAIDTAARNRAGTAAGGVSIDVGANDARPENEAGTGLRVASYKRLGSFRPTRAILLPNAPCDVQAWLSDRLGAIEWVRIEASKEPEAHPDTAWSNAAE